MKDDQKKRLEKRCHLICFSCNPRATKSQPSHKKEAEHSGHSEAGVVTCVLAGMICGLMMFVFCCVFSEMVRRMINHSQVVRMLPVLTRLAVAVVRYPLGRSLGRTNC